MIIRNFYKIQGLTSRYQYNSFSFSSVHARAYSEETYDFRYFVLLRVLEAQQLVEKAESTPEYDDDWTELINLQLTPHPELSEEKRKILLTNYAATNDEQR